MVTVSRLCEVLTIKLRGINYQVAHLVSKKDHIVRRVGFNHVRDSIWRRHLSIFSRGVMIVECLRPGLWKVLTIKLRGIKSGQILITKKPTWEGGAIVTSPCNCGRRKPNFVLGVWMAEWSRPGLWEVLTSKLRGIEPGQVLITKKPTGEGWCSVTSPCNCGRRKPIFWGSEWPSG